MRRIMAYRTLCIKGLIWCQKLEFMDKDTEQRLAFRCGDVIQYHDNKIGRLDRVLVHELLDLRREFCHVTEVLLTQDQKMMYWKCLCYSSQRISFGFVSLPYQTENYTCYQ